MNREDIERMARMVFDVETDSRGRETFSSDNYAIERFAALVAAAEREACADLCEQWNASHPHALAAAIRARGRQ